jgi:hypothetical protein
MSANPKLKKPVDNPENSPNICIKKPELTKGRYRLCFYPHTIILCKTGIEPAQTPDLPKKDGGLPPFKVSDFIEFPVGNVSTFFRGIYSGNML